MYGPSRAHFYTLFLLVLRTRRRTVDPPLVTPGRNPEGGHYIPDAYSPPFKCHVFQGISVRVIKKPPIIVAYKPAL